MKTKEQVAIVIPIYKPVMTKGEECSLRQGLKILQNRDIYFVTNRFVDLSCYNRIAEELSVNYRVVLFDQFYFDGIQGYNQLMLNVEFYRAFKSYDYILIYQLDAYIFRDDLDAWCSKGYDYVGAPWFENFSCHEKGASLWAVGNGGFSLRKVHYFIKVLTWNLPIKKVPVSSFWGNFSVEQIKFMLGKHNNMNYYLGTYDGTEDYFYSIMLSDSWIPPYVPLPIKAIQFAFERSPAYLFELNNRKLPMGCHAFERYGYDEFWSRYIKSVEG